MTAKQQNKLTSYRSLRALLQSTTETGGIASLPARLTAFIALIATIDDLDRLQNLPIRGKVGDRDKSLLAAIHAALELAGYAYSYARENGLHDLAEKVNVSEADFRRLRLTRRPGLAQQVHDAVAPIVAQLASYNADAGALPALQGKIDAAVAALAEPRVTVTQKKAATQAMATAFADADDLLETHIDPLLFPLQKSNPEFYLRYRAAREVLDAPGGAGAQPAPEPVVGAATSATPPAANARAAA